MGKEMIVWISWALIVFLIAFWFAGLIFFHMGFFIWVALIGAIVFGVLNLFATGRRRAS